MKVDPQRTLYDHPMSANCQKIHMMLAIADLPYHTEFVDVVNGAGQADWFISLNPLRQIPVLRDGDNVIADSQSILVYLAMKYAPDWIDPTPLGMARITAWLSFAAKEASVGPQMARLFHLTGEVGINIDLATAASLQTLGKLERHLSTRDWLCLDRPTIADIAVFPYIATARDGHLPLDDFFAILAWLSRIRALPDYKPLTGMATMADKYRNSKDAYA
jgi:glutathione S-transferase